MNSEQLLEKITSFYLQSRDFNGIPLRDLENDDLPALRELVEDQLITVVFGDTVPNPSIKSLPDDPLEVALGRLERYGIQQACAYPTAKHLATVVKRSDYDGQPYHLALALGRAQLDHKAFDLRILEYYRNDPRYSYECDDVFGQIHVHSDDSDLPERDIVYLSFGFSFDSNAERYVAAFPWDLFKLSPKQQRLWQVHEIDIPTKLDSDYMMSQIYGYFPKNISVYQAFTMELATINEMAQAMGRPHLFRKDFRENRPKNFASLLRPTVREFNQFAQTLDAMISDNIKKDFFLSDISSDTKIPVGSGEFKVEPKGTLLMLSEWLALRFRAPDRKPLLDMLATFKEIRELRSKPAHTPVNDEFSKEIAAQQRDLMSRAYTGIRTLRLMFAC